MATASLSGMATVPLTSLSHGAGCGCKLAAQELLPILEGLEPARDGRLLVGSGTADDAAVFQLTPEVALVQTVDFFTPIVDDPYEFGRIAAANALSDVYAMGGVPVTALNVLAFPLERLGPAVLSAILEGGESKAAEAGCAIVGGHSIDDPEPKYGLAVTGTVDPDRMLTNDRAAVGEVLVLTKPLGAGAIATAHKRGLDGEQQLAEAVSVMSALNADASRAALEAGARAATDVTGFGLLGHLHSMAVQSGVAAELHAAEVPFLDGVEELLRDGQAASGGSRRNLAHAEQFASFAPDVPAWRRWLTCDATTSGGLLVSVAAERAGEIPGALIGRIVEGDAGAVSVV
jgi:selenide,water dikinase